jgi:hypothetical protein
MESTKQDFIELLNLTTGLYRVVNQNTRTLLTLEKYLATENPEFRDFYNQHQMDQDTQSRIEPQQGALAVLNKMIVKFGS